MPEIREQAKNCIEKVRFSLETPPVRGDMQGGNVFIPPGTVLSIRGGKGAKTDPKARGAAGRQSTAGRALFFCVTPGCRQIGQNAVSKRCCFQGFSPPVSGEKQSGGGFVWLWAAL